jgi:Domain of unknown function (DUF4307)
LDSAILADGTDKNCRRVRQVSETHTTAPAFPPGRYGRRRDGRRHLAVPIAILAVVIVVCALISVRLYRQYGDPNYDAQIVRWTGVTATQMTIDFTVQVPAGGSATCFLRAQAYDGAEVGSRTVTVTASGDDTTLEASEVVTTTARASVGQVVGCQPPG